MKIEQKLLFGSLALVLVPMAAMSIYSFTNAVDMAEGALLKGAETEMLLARESEAQSLEQYISDLKHLLQVQASSLTVRDAMFEFKSNFFEAPQTNTAHADLEDYYLNQYGEEFRNRNPQSTLNSANLLSGLDSPAKHWQDIYIAKNPNPLGSKDALNKANDGSFYSGTHEIYHPFMHKMLDEFGLYDIFLVDIETGHIIYSVFKELDFATSLLDGPYADSGIAEAFREAAKLEEGQSYLTSFASYIPSYNDPASFIATPVVINGKKEGVMIYQMPLNNISALLSFHGDWEGAGLGKTGQALFMTEQGALLNNPRRLIQDPAVALDMLENHLGETQVERIKANGSAIGSNLYEPMLQYNGQGLVRSTSPMGRDVMTTIDLKEIAGQNWYILAEKETDEILEPAGIMARSMLKPSLFIGGALVLVLLIGAVKIFIHRMMDSVTALSSRAHELGSSQGADLTQRLDVSRKDELSEVAAGLNKFFSRIRNIIRDIRRAAKSNEATLKGLDALSLSTKKQAEEQSERTAIVATATTQMSASIAEVSTNVDQANQGVMRSRECMQETEALFTLAKAAMRDLAKDISESGEVVSMLRDRANDIGDVLTVIRDIAEQTNLLALNAAIEAARAGDQGRGFAVVADEVRQLAQRTQDSTLEVDKIVESLQSQASKAVGRMDHSVISTEKTIESFSAAEDLLKILSDKVDIITDELAQVASAAVEQNHVAADVAKNLAQLDQLSETVKAAFGMMHDSLAHMSAQSRELYQLVSVFKVDEDEAS
ncbi:MAG: methyl-accepting chemotaxis protein [Pseudomonadota bacterium]|nr:methyl-accepting chemotaxis protein [Pseudomonadota bacterium]